MHNNPFNLIISGLGGQGVFTLTKALWKLCEMNNIKCQSSTFKGGAQKHGSIYSVLRIFIKDNKHYDLYSTQILEQELDLIIGLEAWETLRYKEYFNEKTKILMNHHISPFQIERIDSIKGKDPVQLITDLNLDTLIRDFSAKSKQSFGTTKMVNFLLGLEVFKIGIIPFNTADYIKVFEDQIHAGRKLKSKLMNYK
ncbi:MAG: hypothetical protein GY874_05790 [Desulfobacteraceae bacterium]|nr:hypothetical protein [Desulfobacteraceae bacterium]